MNKGKRTKSTSWILSEQKNTNPAFSSRLSRNKSWILEAGFFV